MKQRLFFDVTQLVHWPGRLTGIPRIMHELATRFASDTDSNCRFVTWVPDLKYFCEVNLEVTLAQRGRGIAYLTDAHPLGDRPSSLKIRLKTAAKASLKRLDRLSPPLTSRLAQKIRRGQLQKLKPVDFRAGDQLFITWGEWGNQDFIEHLRQAHQRGLEIIQNVNDIGPIAAPQFANAGNAAVTMPQYLKAVLPLCSLVVSISESTKKMLLEWLKANKLPQVATKVYRLGDDFSFAHASRPTNEAFVNSGLKGQDFLLMVGTVEPKKNHYLLYNVYKLARSQGIDLPKLVIVGRLGWRSDDIFAIMSEDPEVNDKFVWLLDTSDEELSWLYDNCLFSIFASFFEGWGIPVAESLQRGVPVLTSNATSLPEVAGQFADYFSPAATEECLTKISHWLKPANLAKARAKAKQYRPTTWDTTFQQIKRYLTEIV